MKTCMICQTSCTEGERYCAVCGYRLYQPYFLSRQQIEAWMTTEIVPRRAQWQERQKEAVGAQEQKRQMEEMQAQIAALQKQVELYEKQLKPSLSHGAYQTTCFHQPIVALINVLQAIVEKGSMDPQAQVVTLTASRDNCSQMTFNVVLTSTGRKKIGVIKLIREITGMGLRESKTKADSLPSVIIKGVSKAEAENIQKQLEDIGAVVQVRNSLC